MIKTDVEKLQEESRQTNKMITQLEETTQLEENAI
jgi:hypothetical protein